MSSNEKKQFLQVLDQLPVQEPSVYFEQRLHQDWERTILNRVPKKHYLSSAIALAKTHRRVTALLGMVVITASILLSQYALNSQEEDLRQIDTLSELSLSTI